MEFLFFVIGAFFGSFYLVIGTRLPLKENVITGRSRCDSCKNILKWYELIPIISFLIQGGKCRNCHKKITLSHLFIEISSGILFLIGYLKYGISYSLIIYLVLISLSLLIIVSDFKYMIILDSPLIISSIIIMIVKYLNYGMHSLLISIISGLGLFLTMFIIKLIGDKLFKRESLGGGDIKLCFVIGLSIGYRLGLIALIFASFLALPYALAQNYLNKKNELPYGPFLIVATTIIYFFLHKFVNLLIFFF